MQELERWLNELGFVLPPIPATLPSALRQQSEHVFTSRNEVVHPYDYGRYLNEALTPDVADYVLVGHAGHGSSSYAISYFVACCGVRILFQIAWGGLYTDNVVAGRRVCDAFRSLHVLWPALEARDRTLPPFLVASSDLYGGRMARAGATLESWRDETGVDRAIALLRRELGLDEGHASTF